MSWGDRLFAIVLLLAWLLFCIALINRYDRRSKQINREFVSRRTLQRYQEDHDEFV